MRSMRVRKFSLLMWKNWMLQYRRPKQTIIEIAGPVFIIMSLLAIRNFVSPTKNNTVTFQPFQPLPNANLIDMCYNLSLHRIIMAYSPTNDVLDFAMAALQRCTGVTLMEFNRSTDMELYFEGNPKNQIFMAVQFDDDLHEKNAIPQDLNVYLRFPSELRKTNALWSVNNWVTDYVYSPFLFRGPRNPESQYGASPNYYKEGFLTVQMLMTYFLIFSQSTPTQRKHFEYVPDVQMQRFPHYAWTEDIMLEALRFFMGILIMLSYIYPSINIVKDLTMEKENQMKETMKIMGLPNWLHWAAWFLKCFMYLFITAVLIVVLLKLNVNSVDNVAVMTYSDWTLIAVFILVYTVSLITFCFAISVFFRTANNSTCVVPILMFLSFFPFMILQRIGKTSSWVRFLFSIFTNTAMGNGFDVILQFESTGEGSHWNNVWEAPTPDVSFTLGHAMMFLIAEAVVHFVVAIYVEAVLPGDYGVPLPWNFFCSRTYWRSHRLQTEVKYSGGNLATGRYTPSQFDTDTEHQRAGVNIKNLYKTFGDKVAVNNLNLRLYEDQISVLLGHNGAGKSTTVSMLIGMYPPTSGTALISGYDIRKDIRNVRESLGFCPQHNIIFNDLTVAEHIYFFSRLKGLTDVLAEQEVDTYIELLDLTDKRNVKAFKLSGGMKRKMSVAIALCGNSKVVMLDEPTSGMDPSARRFLWNLLQAQKKGRTILLTTHFLDEADILGDRIAIMGNGELMCVGTPYDLKKQYGIGYHLVIDKDEACDAAEITKILKNCIPHIQPASDVGSELSYYLPENSLAQYETLFADLETRRTALKIKGYGISLSSLEDVFMKVLSFCESGNDSVNCEVEDRSTPVQYGNQRRQSMQRKLQMHTDLLLTGSKLYFAQILATVLKRAMTVWRSLWTHFFHLLMIPISTTVMLIILSTKKLYQGQLPSMKLSLDTFSRPVTLVDDRTNMSRFSQVFDNILDGHQIKYVDNIQQFMLRKSRQSPSEVASHYIVGMTFDEKTVTSWFNNNPYHSPGVAMNLVMNTLYKYILGTNYSIQFWNYPMPYKAITQMQKMTSFHNFGFDLAFNTNFAAAILVSLFVLFYIKEAVCKAKHLQFVSGLNVFVYWFTSYIFDLLLFCIAFLALTITLFSYQNEGYSTAEEFGKLYLILFIFAASVLPVLYLMSKCFAVPMSGYARTVMASIISGNVVYVLIIMMSIPAYNLQQYAKIFHNICIFNPFYAMPTAIKNSYALFMQQKLCNQFVNVCQSLESLSVDTCWALACINFNRTNTAHCCDRNAHYLQFTEPGIGKSFLASIFVTIVAFMVLFLIDTSVWSRMLATSKNLFHLNRKEPPRLTINDTDVNAEVEKVHAMDKGMSRMQYALIMEDLCKIYNNKMVAVDNLCLAVKRGECFGLLGVNGAGKTSTFKMMTGDTSITSGDIWVNGQSVRQQFSRVKQYIGYCPQFDALLDDLTVWETLRIFCLIRGIPLKSATPFIYHLAVMFDFAQHMNKQIKRLSGGNKRKVSTAIALIGAPTVIYLDEPSTSMDPLTKRKFWNAISDVRQAGKCVILTSHSMEECEALCTRMAIMVNGQFKCMGSAQHLKTKFSDGCTLIVKCKKGTTEEMQKSLEDFIMTTFGNVIKRETHQTTTTYFIPNDDIAWSRMFGIMEANRTKYDIEDYSLSQSTLEQIFLMFSRQQRAET